MDTGVNAPRARTGLTAMAVLACMGMLCCRCIGGTAAPIAIDARGMVLRGMLLNARLSQTRIAPGESVEVIVDVRNVGQTEHRYWIAYNPDEYVATDAHGNLIKSKDPRPFSGPANKLAPGTSIDVREPLDHLYDLSKPGVYVVVLALYADPRPGADPKTYIPIRMVSNAVVLTVGDESAPPAKSGLPPFAPAYAKSLGVTPEGRRFHGYLAQEDLDEYACGAKWKKGAAGKYTVFAGGRKVTVRAGSVIMTVGNKQFKMAAPAKVDNGELWLPADGLSVVATLCVSAKLKIPLPPQLR